MGKTLIAVATVLLAGCQPMYGDKAATMKNPQPIKPPKDLPLEVVKVTYDEDCELITKPVKNPRRNFKLSQDHVRTADQKLATAEKLAEPKARGDLFVDGIDDYRTALITDPFSAEATLKLAIAYDKVLRKGCALALLGRLTKLAENPTYAEAANEKIDEVADQKKMFEGYRPAALKAIGR